MFRIITTGSGSRNAQQILKKYRPMDLILLNTITTTQSNNRQPIPQDFGSDIIGPPDKESNLRPILRFECENETPLQQRLRHKRDEVQDWNQKFWANHNKRFFEEKAEFIDTNKAHPNDVLSPDKMSEFYKAFLDKNWRIHCLYNVSWYMKNVDLLFLSLQVNIQKVYRKLKK